MSRDEALAVAAYMASMALMQGAMWHILIQHFGGHR